MSIRDVLNILIDAPDKDKPVIIECPTDIFKNVDPNFVWQSLDVVKVTNCTWGTVVEIELRKEEE